MEAATQSYPLYSTQAINHQMHGASSWHHNEVHVSGPSPALTSAYSGVAFSEYPSPAPSSTSPPFSQSEQFLGQSQPSPTLSSAGPLLSPSHFSQMDPKSGPDRTAPRRARQIADPIGRVRRTSTGTHRASTEAGPSSLHLPPSRRQSLDENDHFGHGPDDLSLQIGASTSQQMQSPVAHPMTPASIASPSFPPLPRTHLRNASSASSHNFRTASPALSAVSSVSSTGGPPRMGYPTYERDDDHDTTNEEPGRAKHKKRRLDNAQRKLICQYAQKYPNARQEDIAKVHGVERSTISKILKYKEKWLTMADTTNGAAKQRPSKFPVLEHEMLNWVEEVSNRGETISDKSIREAGKEVARRLNIPEEKFKASSGWVENFKSRANIRQGVWLDAQAAKRPPLPPPEADTLTLPGATMLPSTTALHAALKMAAYTNVPTTSHGDDPFSASPCSPIAHDYDPQASAERALGSGLLPPPPWNAHIGDPSSSTMPLSALSPHSPTSPHHEDAMASRLVSPLTHQPLASLASQDPSRMDYYSEYNYGPKPIPTFSQTEDALDTLASFVDTHRVLKPEQRDWLTKIKEALHRYANSSLAERTRSP